MTEQKLDSSLEKQTDWKKERDCLMESNYALQQRIVSLETSLGELQEIRNREMADMLRQRRTSDTMVSYLDSKARMMRVPAVAQSMAGIRQDGIGGGLVDKKGVAMADWKREWENPTTTQNKLESKTVEERCTNLGVSTRRELDHMNRVTNTVAQVTDTMTLLVKRAIVAEHEAREANKTMKACQVSAQERAAQVDKMWGKVEVMEESSRLAGIQLEETQQRLAAMDAEVQVQRERASRNEREIASMKEQFGHLRRSLEHASLSRESVKELEERLKVMESKARRLNERLDSLETAKHNRDDEVLLLQADSNRLLMALSVKDAELMAIGEEMRDIFEQHALHNCPFDRVNQNGGFGATQQ